MYGNTALRPRLTGMGLIGLMISVLIMQGCSLSNDEYEGTWVVTELVESGHLATDSQPAEDQLGLSVTYLSDQAQLGQHHCASPTYTVNSLPSSEFEARFRVTTDSLFANRDDVKQVQVSCAQAGAAFGQLLLLQSDGSAYTVSNGVFYRLEKADTQTG